MTNSNILFDDWETRQEFSFKRRKKKYIICSFFVGFSLVVSILVMFFELAAIVAVVISLIVFIIVYLEWLKIKNNHLIIKKNQIEITNRYNKTVIYELDINELVLELRHSLNYRSGGIIMKFYDSQNNLIFKYEDMLNKASPFVCEKTNWEKSLESLGAKIIDNEEIIKNN